VSPDADAAARGDVVNPLPEGIRIRNLEGRDLETLIEMDWRGLPRERFSIYLLFCVHFGATSLVAEKDGSPVAVLIGSTDVSNRLAYLNHLVVWEAWEGRGIARAMIGRWFRILRGLGVRRAWLHGDLRLYSRFGFYESGDLFDPAIMDHYRAHGKKVLACDL
jgi:GNAT superfamily N-acetyltransferase